MSVTTCGEIFERVESQTVNTVKLSKVNTICQRKKKTGVSRTRIYVNYFI